MDDVPAVALVEEPEFWVSRSLRPNQAVSATVVIPTYDACDTLDHAVQSALDQTLQDIEVIVVDDASTDSSWAMISRWLRQDPRLRAIRHKRNQGKCAAMNRASRIARGRWMAVLDADDWYEPDRLAALIGLGESRHADLVADNQYFFDVGAVKIVGTAWPAKATAWALTFDGFLKASNAYETFNLGMLKPVVRMEYVRQKLLAYEERMRHGQDFFYLLQFFLAGGGAVISDMPHYNYTQPYGAISRQWSHALRRRYDFQSAYDINRSFIDAMVRRLEPSQIARLRRRNQRLKHLEYFFQAKECLARHDWFGTMVKLVRHPSSLSYALRRLWNRILPRPPSAAIERIAAGARWSVAQGAPREIATAP